jgi:plastocyanin
MRITFAALAVAATLLPGPGVGDAAAADKAQTHTVVIDATAYAPATLTVKRGDTVTWVNKDPFPHTVTAAGKFDSKDIGAGKSWKYVARSAGRFDYICIYHPTMKGTLVVE